MGLFNKKVPEGYNGPWAGECEHEDECECDLVLPTKPGIRTLMDNVKAYLEDKPQYEKLVRDLIPEFSKEKKDGGRFRKPKDEKETLRFLAMKLIEETMEVVAEIDTENGKHSRKKIVEEIADARDVLTRIAQCFEIDEDTINTMRIDKGKAKGKFTKLCVWDMTTRGL